MDIGIAAAFLALSLSEIATSDSVRSAWEHVLVSALPMVAIAWRRQYPVLVAVAVVLSNLLGNPDQEFTTVLSLVLVSFTVGAELPGSRAAVGLAAVLTPFLVGMALQQALVPSDIAAGMVFIAGPWAVGTILRQRVASAEEAIARAERLEREQERQALEAAAAERQRIARELHDIVSHSISVVTIQTQAVRRRLGPEQTAEAADLAMVEATARQALAEMRRLFGVLRTDGEAAALEPQPGLSELQRLVDSVGAGGPRIRLTVEGDPVPLPPGVDLAAYRIAQEGLTNALRHSGADEVVLTVRHRPESVDVEVLDNGRGVDPARTSGGHGLVGVRERVMLYGGSVELTSAPTGGARLAARLPLSEAR